MYLSLHQEVLLLQRSNSPEETLLQIVRQAKATEPCSVEKVLVHSNKKKGETVNLTGGLVRLMYYESLLANSIRATYTYTDSGNATNNQKTGTSCDNTATAVDGLPIVGEEKTDLIFTDK